MVKDGSALASQWVVDVQICGVNLYFAIARVLFARRLQVAAIAADELRVS